MSAKPLSITSINLLKILTDGKVHSGAALGNKLTITRAAVWKLIKQLQSYGVEIISLQSSGYILQEEIKLLSRAAIVENLVSQDIACDYKFKIFSSIPSTNQYLLDFPLACDNDKVICLSESQTSGRGRFGRSWHSPFAKNIYFSQLWSLSQDISVLNGLGIAVCVAVVNALTSYGIRDIGIKWPNDILYQGEKLAGILIELRAEANGALRVVIGVGINVNLYKEVADINQPWTSLRKITNTSHDRNIIVGRLISEFDSALKLFLDQGSQAFLDVWEKHDYLKGKAITLHIANDKQAKGIVSGIDARGWLGLADASGKVSYYSAGDTSISPR
ncbi:MAG: bifunctional biotin--[acetyl-CoA-carboxylase] synthetase/biotin operon repressor [Thiotrichales bacterium]|nr:MAG: bifunctional biotin--[acetyl-CoA-carboxylase] synthetase/biotin operon repressor [Thiotrichales bacterium]